MKNTRYFKSLSVAASALATASLLAACGSAAGTSASGASASGTPTSGGNENSSAATTLADAATPEEALAVLQQKGTLSIGTEGTYSPFTYHDPSTSELTGYDVEVITAVADKLGLEPQFSEVKWDGLLSGLETGRYDVVANQVAVTDERKEIYEFSSPYTISTPVVIVRSDDTSITTLADVEGKDAAQSVTSNWAELARESGATVVPVDGFTESVAALRDGRVDVMFNDSLAVLDYFTTTGDESVKAAFEVPDDRSDRSLVVRKGEVGLAELLTQTIEELREEGALAELGQKYFGEDVSQ